VTCDSAKISASLACATLFLAVSGAMPGAARADVLEVGGGSFSWVAGGPAGAMLPPESGEIPGAIPGADPAAAVALPAEATHPLSYTPVAGAAGPHRFSGRVAELAVKYDISPALLEALVWQESRWNTAARSPVGARGLTQLMPGTARELGVDPADPHANLEGGARYLRMQLDAFGGDLEKALAAYNAGPARVARAGGIPAIRETRLYVASIMARLAEPVRR